MHFPGIGTAANMAAIIVGGLLGLLCGKKIKEEVKNSLISVLGLATIFVGASGALAVMLPSGADGKNGTYGGMMMILCLVLGTLLGELLHIEAGLEKFGEFLKRRVGAQSDAGFTAAFVNASLVVCVGAMAIVGSIQDGLLHDPSTLYAKAVLDFLIILIMASTGGIGCLFSFLPVALLQGGVTALAALLEPVFSDGVLRDLSLVGNVMITAVGVNLVFGKKFRVANMLPAVVLAVVYSLLFNT